MAWRKHNPSFHRRRRLHCVSSWLKRIILVIGMSISALGAVSKEPDDYLLDVWTIDNGLPQNSINAIAQTKDGYLWLATFDGLVRYDGV